MFPLPAAVALAARAHAEGGFTFRIADGTFPRAGYSVSRLGHEVRLARGEALAPHHIADYMAQHAEAFDHHGACLGAWLDTDTDRWYLDVSTVVPTREQAEALGRTNVQLAVFDLAQCVTIPVTYGPLDNEGTVVMEGA
jgi:hypothetical protein